MRYRYALAFAIELFFKLIKKKTKLIQNYIMLHLRVVQYQFFIVFSMIIQVKKSLVNFVF